MIPAVAALAAITFAPAWGASADGLGARAYAADPVLNVDAWDEGSVPFKCPIERIRSAYQNLVDPSDTLVALAIEKQTLSICRQSQEALIRIAENEARLRELFERIIAPPTVSGPEPTPAAAVEPAPLREPREEAARPSYELESTIGDAEGFKAQLVDGGAILTVREGDILKDGTLVVRIRSGVVELLSAQDVPFVLR